MTGCQARCIAAVVTGCTTLSAPGYAQVSTRGVGVSAPEPVSQTVRSVVEATRETAKAAGHPWLVREARGQDNRSGRGLCSACGVLAGAGLGFAAHEGGHLVANWMFGTDVYLKKVEGGGVPFFAITHRDIGVLGLLTVKQVLLYEPAIVVVNHEHGGAMSQLFCVSQVL